MLYEPPSGVQPQYYTIRVGGQLSPSWSEWFGGMTITEVECGETLLSGTVADQAALHGLLGRIRDLNLTLVSVTLVKAEPSRPAAVE